SMKCFTATTYLRWSQSTKPSSWQRLSAALNRAVLCMVFSIACEKIWIAPLACRLRNERRDSLDRCVLTPIHESRNPIHHLTLEISPIARSAVCLQANRLGGA